MSSANQPQPPRGPDEDVEPQAREVVGIKCSVCLNNIWWDGRHALWCEDKHCSAYSRVYWNADLRDTLFLHS